MKKTLVLAAFAAILTACGADVPPPPSENPLLFDDIKPLALHKLVVDAESKLTGEAAKLKTTCHDYYDKKAFAQATGAPAGRFELDPGVEKSCAPFRNQMAAKVGAAGNLSLSSAMFADPLVWAKIANGKRSALFQYRPDEKDDRKEANEKKEKSKAERKSDPLLDKFGY